MTSLHIRYAQEFSDLSLGTALLHPPSKGRLHPGVCGYFDSDGDFKTIVDIPQIKMEVSTDLNESKFTSLDQQVQLPEPEVMNWEPKTSSKMTVDNDDASAG